MRVSYFFSSLSVCLHLKKVIEIHFSTWFGVYVNQEVPLLNNQLVPCNARASCNQSVVPVGLQDGKSKGK